MNMIKKNGGFTLVELIVVIAILAILAGVAIPAYSGYITKAKDAAVITELDAIATAAQAANATAGEIAKIEVTDEKAVKVSSDKELASTYVADFDIFYGGRGTLAANATSVDLTLNSDIGLTGTSYANGATWEAGKWTAVSPTPAP